MSDDNNINGIGETEEIELTASPGTFTSLANLIKNSGNQLKLTKNYTYSDTDSNYMRGIIIDKKITIDGNGFTIDGNKKAKAFYVSSENVVFKNINFINCQSVRSVTSSFNYGNYGGSIRWEGDYGTMFNCTFINSISSGTANDRGFMSGGAILWEGNYGNIDNCTFINSTSSFKSNTRYADSRSYGGAICWSGNDGILSNCYFINSKCISKAICNWYTVDKGSTYCTSISDSYGGAIYCSGSNNILCNCSFINSITYSSSSAIWSACNLDSGANGGDIYWSNSGNISNCSFVNSYSNSFVDLDFSEELYGMGDIKNCSKGSSIYFSGDNVFVNNCSFMNIHSRSNGTVYSEGDNGHMINSNFINCSSEYGGAIYCNGLDGYVNNCSFIDCYCIYYGDSIYWVEDNGRVFNSSFISSQNYAQEIYLYWMGLYGSIENSKVDDLSKLYNSKYKIKLLNNKIGVILTIESPHDGVVIGTIKDFNNKPLSNINLSYVFNDNDGSNITDNDGQIIVNGLFGNTIIHIKYEGDETYADCYKSATFNFTNSSINNTNQNTNNNNGTIEPKITVPPLNKPSNDGSVTIILPSDSTGIVTLTINGKDYSFAIVNGKANVLIPNLGDGNYPYTITYSGDSKYSSFTTNGSLNKVDSTVDSIIVAKNTNVLYTANGKYSVTVYGTDGKVAKNTLVTFKINGKQVGKGYTNENGIATYTVKIVPGTYKISATALGKTVTKTLTVKHLVTLKTVTVKKSAKQLVLQATLGKVNGKYLNKKTVTFKFNGKTYKAKTNSKGVAKLTIKSSVLKKLKVGKKVTYQATYSKDTVKKTVTVKK